MADTRRSVLFLGYDDSRTRVVQAIRDSGWAVTHAADKVTDLSGHDVVISYGYRYLLSAETLASAKRPAINLHVSYLPYNRGAHPNFWSFMDGTPSGVTIHEIDSGIDTGPIVVQRYVNFDASEITFSATYQRLHRELEALFVEHVDALLNGTYTARPQRGRGTYHSTTDLPEAIRSWDVGIDDTIARLGASRVSRHDLDMSLVDEIENVRTRNNVNWMDLLRIAVTHAPAEAKRVIGRINADDGRISELLKKLSER